MATTLLRPASSDFRRFWLASAVSNLGDGIRLAAMPLLALELTEDARLVAGVTAATFLPWILVGPIAGAVVDRRDRRTLMLLGQAVRGFAVLLLALSATAGWANIAILYLAAAVISAGETLVDSAVQAAVPRLVSADRLVQANGRLTAAENLFNEVVGIALGAVLFASASSLPFYVDGASFVLGALLIGTIRRPLQGERTVPASSLRADIADGFRFLFGHPMLRRLAASASTTMLALHMGLGVMVVLVVDELAASRATYGTILAVGSVGGVLGSLVANRLTELLTPRRTLKVTHVPFVLAAALAAVSTDTWMVSAAFALSSFALVIFQIPNRALRQRVTPDHLLGRVVSAFRIFGLGGPVIGAPLGGAVAEAFGVRWAFVASSVVMVIAWALTLLALRHYPEESIAALEERRAA
jgi:MFS family permease